MINVFIDTNVLLDFYHLSNDDLEELNKLIVAIDESEITLFFTDQVVDEFKRNREIKISESLKLMDNIKLGMTFPRVVQSYPEYQLMQTEIRNFGEHLSTMISRLNSDVKSKTLGPDALVEQLFDRATIIPESQSLYEDARKRSLLRRPPGKKDSMGDCLNWLALMGAIPDGEDIFIVSRDGDFRTQVSGNELSDYLQEEWHEKKESAAKLCKGIGEFFKDNYPDIKLATDLKRQKAVQQLVASGNFLSTHRYIRKLSSLGELSDQEARDVFDAALSNTQIMWLGEDNDVNSYIRGLMSVKSSLLDPEETERLSQLYPDITQANEEEAEINFDDLPF
jgi:predicted nucleic acid-binding protein